MHSITGQPAALSAGAHFKNGRAENLRPRRLGRRCVALVAAALSVAALMAPASHAAVAEQTALRSTEVGLPGGETARKVKCFNLVNGKLVEVKCPDVIIIVEDKIDS